MPKKRRLPGTYLSRVFVGGSYRSQRDAAERKYDEIPPRDRLAAIADEIRALGLEPILAIDFELENEERDLHDVTLFLLHSCSVAVFELSEFSGALMEIERTADYGTRAIILYHDPIGKSAWRTTNMLKSFAMKRADSLELSGYVNMDGARLLIRDWVYKMRMHGHVR